MKTPLPINLSEIDLLSFIAKIEKSDGCWLWRGATMNGYGRYAGFAAHRISYSLFKRQIPDGLVVDHKCYNKQCVNPGHLQATTAVRNIKLAAVYYRNKYPFCPSGHDQRIKGNHNVSYNGKHYCGACRREYARKYKKRKSIEIQAKRTLYEQFKVPKFTSHPTSNQKGLIWSISTRVSFERGNQPEYPFPCAQEIAHCITK